ncbi:hypothetical protein K438DRAFT_1636014 [Mycena galopus ATCC 62051]|nr:hypothetical protein K438DRAFT_1636014 [Mycena galopus ATCC 62051]
MGTGGKSKYIPKHNQEWTIASKWTTCPCRLVSEIYPGTPTILGRYENYHSHPIGSQNLIYTNIPAAVLCRIEDDLRRVHVRKFLSYPFPPPPSPRPRKVHQTARRSSHSEENRG